MPDTQLTEQGRTEDMHQLNEEEELLIITRLHQVSPACHLDLGLWPWRWLWEAVGESFASSLQAPGSGKQASDWWRSMPA